LQVPGKACLDGAGPQEGEGVLVSGLPPGALAFSRRRGGGQRSHCWL